MGYRSQVAFEINGPTETILAGLASIRLITKVDTWSKNIDHLLFQAQDEGNRASLLFSVEDWKWYSDYEDVDFFEEIYRHFEDLNHDDVWGYFARVGEDKEDIEERHFGDYQWDGAIELVPATLHVIDGEYSSEIPRIKSSAAGKDNPQNPE